MPSRNDAGHTTVRTKNRKITENPRNARATDTQSNMCRSVIALACIALKIGGSYGTNRAARLARWQARGRRARRHILYLLKDVPQTTGAVCDALSQIDRCTVMQHLKVLEKAGLVVVERRGRERWNHLDALPIHDIQNRWVGPYAAYAVTMMAQIKGTLDDEAAPASAARVHNAPDKT